MSNHNTYFWTLETNNGISKWIETKSDVLWFDVVQPALKYYACYCITRYSRNNIGNRDMYVNLVTHAAMQLLEKYNAKKGRTYRSYVHKIMMHYLWKEHNLATSLKRDCRKNVSIAALDPLETESWTIDNPAYSYLNDPEFVRFFIAYWKLHVDEIFTIKGARTVKLIIDIIESPEKHPIRENNYLSYLNRKLGLTRQAIHLTIQKMQTYNESIKAQYNITGLLKVIIPS